MEKHFGNVFIIITRTKGKNNMLEKILIELAIIRNKKIPDDLIRSCRRPVPDRKHISCIRKWAKNLDIPASLIVRASKYAEMEEIWKV